MKYIIIFFEDCGQDFLYWLVEVETGKVIDCGPFQYSVWEGTIVKYVYDIEIGGEVHVKTKFGDDTTMNYLVIGLKGFETNDIDTFWKEHKMVMVMDKSEDEDLKNIPVDKGALLNLVFEKYNHLFVVSIHGLLWGILMNNRFEDREVAFVTNYKDSELVLGIAEKNLPGYIETMTSFKDKNYEKAQDICGELNKLVFGLTEQKAMEITLSSIGASERFKQS